MVWYILWCHHSLFAPFLWIMLHMLLDSSYLIAPAVFSNVMFKQVIWHVLLLKTADSQTNKPAPYNCCISLYVYCIFVLVLFLLIFFPLFFVFVFLFVLFVYVCCLVTSCIKKSLILRKVDSITVWFYKFNLSV